MFRRNISIYNRICGEVSPDLYFYYTPTTRRSVLSVNI